MNSLVADLADKGDQTLQGWSLVSEAKVVCPLKKEIVLHVDFTLWILLMREPEQNQDTRDHLVYKKIT